MVYIVRPFQSSAKKNFAPNRDFEEHQKNTRYTYYQTIEYIQMVRASRNIGIIRSRKIDQKSDSEKQCEEMWKGFTK